MDLEKQIAKINFACAKIDSFILQIGKVISWLSVALIVAIIIQVILRYVFRIGMVAFEEFQWHLFGVIIMFALSFDVILDKHVRLDLIHRKLPVKGKALVEIFGIVFFLLPMVAVFFIHGLDFVISSFNVGESSDSPMGLPCRWILKSVIPLSMILLGMAATSRLGQSITTILKADNTKKEVKDAS